MNIENTLIIFADILKEVNLIKPMGIHESKHDPHPFTVNNKHLDYSNRENEGVLTEEILAMFPCGADKCNLAYDKHTAHRELVLQLTKDVYKIEVNTELIKIKPFLLKHSIEQIAFADTDEKFKFL